MKQAVWGMGSVTNGRQVKCWCGKGLGSGLMWQVVLIGARDTTFFICFYAIFTARPYCADTIVSQHLDIVSAFFHETILHLVGASLQKSAQHSSLLVVEAFLMIQLMSSEVDHDDLLFCSSCFLCQQLQCIRHASL